MHKGDLNYLFAKGSDDVFTYGPEGVIARRILGNRLETEMELVAVKLADGRKLAKAANKKFDGRKSLLERNPEVNTLFNQLASPLPTLTSISDKLFEQHIVSHKGTKISISVISRALNHFKKRSFSTLRPPIFPLRLTKDNLDEFALKYSSYNDHVKVPLVPPIIVNYSPLVAESFLFVNSEDTFFQLKDLMG